MTDLTQAQIDKAASMVNAAGATANPQFTHLSSRSVVQDNKYELIVTLAGGGQSETTAPAKKNWLTEDPPFVETVQKAIDAIIKHS